MADIAKRLKAAEPTIVLGPSSPDLKFKDKVSITESRISGALLPKAIRVKFATVSFHTKTVKF